MWRDLEEQRQARLAAMWYHQHRTIVVGLCGPSLRVAQCEKWWRLQLRELRALRERQRKQR